MKSNVKLDLSDSERKRLRRNKIKKSEITNLSILEIEKLLNVPEARAREIYALADFQRIPSIGIEFAKDLIFLELYSIEDLVEKTGAKLTDASEKKKGYRIDPCVEDQFRLAVDFSHNQDYTKRWWDFTEDRKNFRSQIGYPVDRPVVNWHEVRTDKKGSC